MGLLTASVLGFVMRLEELREHQQPARRGTGAVIGLSEVEHSDCYENTAIAISTTRVLFHYGSH